MSLMSSIAKTMLEKDIALRQRAANGEVVREDEVSEVPVDTISDSDGTDVGSKATTGGDELAAIRNSMTSQETKHLLHWRILVIMLLIAAAAGVSLTIRYITIQAQMREFERQYNGNADKVIDALQEILVEMAAVSGVAVDASAYAEANQREWPFVTMNSFQARAANAKKLSGALYISINPIVPVENVTEWEMYVNSEANQWIGEGMQLQSRRGLNDFEDQAAVKRTFFTDLKVDPMHTFDAEGLPKLPKVPGPFVPRWQTSPVLQKSLVNENILEDRHLNRSVQDCIDNGAAVLGGFVFSPPGSTSHPDLTTASLATLRSMAEGQQVEYEGDPVSNLFVPIFDTLDGDGKNVVAVLQSTFYWRHYLRGILPQTNNGIRVVLDNRCDGTYTFELRGDEAFVVGLGDYHDPQFSSLQRKGHFRTTILQDGTASGLSLNQTECRYTFRVYPTEAEKEYYLNNQPMKISLSIAAVFAFTLGVFLLYDCLVERRQRITLEKAAQSTAIVSSLFPKQVRERLLAAEEGKRRGSALIAPRYKVKTFLDGTPQKYAEQETIADLFTNCTVMFCDIAGFTAWSSAREPAQVFVLLQTVYQNFDIIAKRRRVFKVETIGDSYLAVTGLPEPQSEHALIMAKFAWDCLVRLGEVLKDLEVSLGPDTGELSMRFGMHSGSVTAGVLKGDRARFQLFGDTVNMAARMESTGEMGKIQISESTAEILIASGKEYWLIPRYDLVNAKGKGVVKTFWLHRGVGLPDGSAPKDASSSECDDLSTSNDLDHSLRTDNCQFLKENRLVGWVTDILLAHVKKVVIVHQRCCKIDKSAKTNANGDLIYKTEEGKICLDEAQNTIKMPAFDPDVAEATLDSSSVEVPEDIVLKLKQYVGTIAKTYRSNPFHNFEHACHVTMSVSKLLTRVVTPELDDTGDLGTAKQGRKEVAAEIHNLTHGLTSDPIATFAIVFAALIHDVDHQGVSNVQLAKEDPELAEYYRHKSVAEQNSLDIAWDLLMTQDFTPLRKYIFQTEDELLRFRQLIVNLVLATDIFDKELGQLRKDRWRLAFHDGVADSDTNDMRATIVMEHIMQASDVAHTMQHWHVYQKWNRKLFHELFQAFKAGRMGADPRSFWYQGELVFFDNYVIPLAKKLKDCNVFGVSSDEYLGYALRNRAEWEERGEEVVRDLISEVDGNESSIAPSPDCTISESSQKIEVKI